MSDILSFVAWVRCFVFICNFQIKTKGECLLELYTVVFKKLKTLVPKHQTPVIGNIESLQADVLRRMRCRGAFQAKSDDHMIFTAQLKTAPSFQRKTMKVLTGDTHFNKWPVTSISLTKLVRCTVDVHEKLFIDPSPAMFHDTEDAPHEAMLTDEAQLADDEVVPFPNEHDMNLAVEQQHIMESQLLVDVGGVGSGERGKAYLLNRLHMVLICMTPRHKKFVWSNLQRFTKEAGLVNLSGTPPKPPELIAYEKTKAGTSLEVKKPPAPNPLPSMTEPTLPTQTPPPSGPPKAPNVPLLSNFGSKLL